MYVMGFDIHTALLKKEHESITFLPKHDGCSFITFFKSGVLVFDRFLVFLFTLFNWLLFMRKTFK